MVADVALPTAFSRLRGLRLDDAAEVRIGGWAFRGLLTLPVEWDGRAAQCAAGCASTIVEQSEQEPTEAQRRTATRSTGRAAVDQHHRAEPEPLTQRRVLPTGLHPVLDRPERR